MKVIRLFIFSVLTISAAITNSYGQASFCPNLGFEMGDFTNWQGYTWITDSRDPSKSTLPKLGIVPGRHTIMTDKAAYDKNTGGKLRLIPIGHNYSARLGDAVTGNLMESLSYKIKVNADNALLVYKFAVVLQDPGGDHAKHEEPRFRVTLLDSKRDTIPDCANYDVYYSDAISSSFQTYYTSPPSTDLKVKWRDWTTVGINLTKYIGQEISLEFMAGDCTKSVHYGYAYFVAECQPLNIIVDYCESDIIASLKAPTGFESYSWLNEAGVELGKNQTYTITSPIEKASYSCTMKSATGCTVTLNTSLVRYTPKALFTANPICKSSEVEFSNSSTSNSGTLLYHWDFGDGTTSTDTNPIHKYLNNGKYKVRLAVSNPPSSCVDTFTQTIEILATSLITIKGDTCYCPSKTTTLKAYGASSYLWSDGSKADSLVVSKDDNYWVIGYSSDGSCASDKKYWNVKVEPTWPMYIFNKPYFCAGDSLLLSASGAVRYEWEHNGSVSPYVYVKSIGTYTVKGYSERGCLQTKSTLVNELPLPTGAKFTVFPSTINVRNNTVECSIIDPQPGVHYLWDMGDETTFEKGENISHTYSSISNSLLYYKITVKAINENECESPWIQLVDVVPFIPNVFTPNGDGVNDMLIEGLDLNVLDRNGKLLYKGINGWDGKFNGRDMPNDTYFYKVNYKDKNGKWHTQKGSVTLIR